LVYVGDFTGNHRSDLAWRNDLTGDWYVMPSNGSGFDSPTVWGNWSTEVTWVDVQVGDFNGDGKSDIVGRVLEWGDWWVGLSTGSSFVSTFWGHWNLSVTWVDVMVGDFNGDGKSDIAGRVREYGDWWVALSTGNSFDTQLWHNPGGSPG